MSDVCYLNAIEAQDELTPLDRSHAIYNIIDELIAVHANTLASKAARNRSDSLISLLHFLRI